MPNVTILVVDDEATQHQILAGYLKKKGFQIIQAANGEEALQQVKNNPIDLILSDMRMPDVDGMALLSGVKELNPEISVVVMTAFSRIEDAVASMKAGAEDYLQKPVDLDELDLIIKRILERRRLISENKELKESLAAKSQFSQLITASAGMEEVLSMAMRASQSRASVLIRGESGTGKEMLARAIHLASPRRESPFIAVNMAALSDNLVESELFGHEKGAFTGAQQQKKGRFELANTGTLFIDEVAEIPATTQVKLLRILQERQYERVGGTHTLSTDVRVIAATHQDLEVMIKTKTFREDLFYRLNVICIFIPPLRDRREDIPILIDHFIRRYSEEEDKPVSGVSRESMDLLMKYNYPGNVRELENAIQRSVVMTRNELLSTDDLPQQIQGRSRKTSESLSGSLTKQVAQLELRLIQEALQNSNDNQSEAARSLGISERHLRYKLKKYNIK
ncbi:sigma-54-dependent Fis family transcriptional regulator [candidate division KSB1 bacterium]|nr:sigma-54-dependent Fis family transcriptional regulator [candidate division KSB1 bacterium]